MTDGRRRRNFWPEALIALGLAIVMAGPVAATEAQTRDESAMAATQADQSRLPPRPPYRLSQSTPETALPATETSREVAAPVATPVRRVPPRPPRRAALDAKSPGVAAAAPKAPVASVALPTKPNVQGLPPAPEPLAQAGDLPASSMLIEGLADYVESPTDPLVGLDLGLGRATPESIEVRPLTPLTPQPGEATASSVAQAASAEQVAVAPPASAPLLPEDEPGTRSLGGMLEEMMEPDAVVARVNGEEILWRAVVESAKALPEDYQGKLESIFPALLQRLVDMKLLAQRARGAGLDAQPDIREKVQAFEEALLREALLRDMLESELSDETLREAYDQYSSESKSHMQVKARHILLETKEDALQVVAALDAGSDFATLARERSIGSSASRGGDLGVVDVARMVPPFAEALARQPLGRHSHWPVQSEFGWHVILVETRQGEHVPPFEQVLPQLRRALGRDLIERRLVDLRNEAEIEIVEPGTAPAPAVTQVESE